MYASTQFEVAMFYVLRGDAQENNTFDLWPIRNLAKFPVQYVTYAPYRSLALLP